MKKLIAILLVFLCIAYAGCSYGGQVRPLPTTANAETSAPEPTGTSPESTTAAPAVDTPEPGAGTPSPQPLLHIPQEEIGKAKHHTFEYNGVKRTYMLYIPKTIRDYAPLVFFLHGYGDFASNFMQTTGMNPIAEKYGFAVVYPQGLNSDDEQFPNNHWNADFTYSDVDDAGYLTALAAYLQDTYAFDAGATFAAGLSNGAFMCYTLALRAPGTFRAIASVAGTMSGKCWEDRGEASPIPILQVHGKSDYTIPIDGTVFLDGGWGGAPALDEVLQFWADLGGADVVTEEEEGDFIIRTYSGEGSEVQIWYYLIKRFDHRWPTEQNCGLNTGELIWEFFSQYVG